MKKETLSIMAPCAVVCLMAFLDVDYAAPKLLDILSIAFALIALVAMACWWVRHRKET